jgi:hypothetical protein
MMADLNDVGQPVHNRNREDLTIPNLANGQEEIDYGLFKPEVLQARFVSGAIRWPHFARLNDARRRLPYWRATAHLQVLDPTKVDVLKQFEKSAFRIG